MKRGLPSSYRDAAWDAEPDTAAVLNEMRADVGPLETQLAAAAGSSKIAV